jgi:hypothetical protein
MPKLRAALLPLFLALAVVAPRAVFAADLRVDDLELLTHGTFKQDSGTFDVSSRLYFILSLEGGDKFSGLLKMNFLNSDIENALNLSNSNLGSAPPAYDQTYESALANRINNLISPQLMTVAVTAKSVFDLPLDLAYFVGQMDNFCSGDDFIPLFGTAPFSTDLRGPMVYPNGVGGNPNVWFDGIYQPDGTGFRLSTTPNFSSKSIGYMYFYQDSNVGSGTWSGDLRYSVNSPLVKADFFAGATTGGAYGVYRGGMLFYATTGDVGEFFAQMGVTRWDPSQPFSINDIFFLFEPRIRFGTMAQAVITLFYHPSWYDQVNYISEQNAMDASFDLRFGRIAEHGSQGGVQTLFAFRPETTDPVNVPALAIDTSPYYSIIKGNVRWDFKLDLRVFPFPSEWYGMFSPYIGLKTSY